MKRIGAWAATAGFVAVCFVAAGVGQLLSGDEPGEWYNGLQKPAFNPPAWVFGPVWTILYLSMGVAASRVWLKRHTHRITMPLALFAAQLVLNALWTGLFFGLQRPDLAFVEIVALWAAIAATTWAFFRVSRPAGWLLTPYLGWVTFAVLLNGTFWRLNA